MTEIDILLTQARNLAYPASMMPALQMIKGRAFFPGGSGVLDNSMTVSDKPIMVLGQDFDTATHYEKSLLDEKECNPTWTNLLNLLKQAGINQHQCFFTNAIMGVRATGKNTSKSPAFKAPDFLQACRQFFLDQLRVQQPKLVLVLGKMPAEFLATMAEDLRPWKKLQTITDIDNADQQLVRDVTFTNNIKTTLALLTHPSFRHLNIHKRRYKTDFTGAEAELETLKEALKTLSAA